MSATSAIAHVSGLADAGVGVTEYDVGGRAFMSGMMSQCNPDLLIPERDR